MTESQLANRVGTIVLGAGVVGSAAAYHLAREGEHVMLLEQFEIGHNRGSSHGESRIMRYIYSDPTWTTMAIQSRQLWRELEVDTGELLLRNIGSLDIGEGSSGQTMVATIVAALEATRSQYELLDHVGLPRRFPQWRVSDDTIAVYRPDAVVLNATHCVRTIAACAATFGAAIHERETALQIIPSGDGVEVITDREHYHSRRLVVAAGAWSSRILSTLGLEIPLRVSQEQVVYFTPRTNPKAFTRDHFPLWLHYREGDEKVYGFPILDVPGIKVAFHHLRHYIDIEDYDQTPRPDVIEQLRTYLERYLPDAAGEVFDTSTCLYTNTPDKDFILDILPGQHHIAIWTGCNGDAFKFSMVIGRALADLVLRGHTSMEVGRLGISRFLTQDSSISPTTCD